VGSRKIAVASVRRIFESMLDRNLILVDPTIGMKPPKTARRLPQSLMSAVEMSRLLNAPDVTDPLGLRDRAILEVFYGTGLRFSELANLTVTEVDLEERILWVRQGKGGKDRVLPLGRWARHWLGRHLKASENERRRHGSDRVFLTSRGNRLDNRFFNERLRAYGRQVGITKHITAHAIRHTFATLLLRGGADVRKIQRLLGHKTLTATEIYTHLTIEDLRKVQETCHPREKKYREEK
jgi:integrase/recombinase XerD